MHRNATSRPPSLRSSAGAVCVVSLVLALLIGAAAPRSFGEELQPDQVYHGGTRVQSSRAGLSFVIPDGWIGRFGQDARNQGLVLGSNTIEGVGIALLQTGQTAARVAASLSEPQNLGGGAVLRPAGPPAIDGTRIAARYQGEEYIGRALGVLGPAGSAAIFFFAGPPKNDQTYQQLLERLTASTTFLPPAAASPAPAAGALGQAWSDLLTGRMLHYFSRYNSGSGGGMSGHKVLHLCSDGRFVYSGDSLITMNVPGASASSGGRNGFQGRWGLEAPTQGTVVLVLSVNGGAQHRWEVEYDGDKTFLNGQRWLRAQSDACR